MYLKTEVCQAYRQVGYFANLTILYSIPGSDVMSWAKALRGSILSSCIDRASLHIAVAGSKRILCLWDSALLLYPWKSLVPVSPGQVPFTFPGCSFPHVLLLILQVDDSSSVNSFLTVPHLPHSSPQPSTEFVSPFSRVPRQYVSQR